MGEGVAEAEAETEAELEGEMRDLDTDVGVGLSLAIGMAVVTYRRDTRPMRRVVRCILVFLCCSCVLYRRDKYGVSRCRYCRPSHAAMAMIVEYPK